MNDNAKKWVTALRSGEYKQGKSGISFCSGQGTKMTKLRFGFSFLVLLWLLALRANAQTDFIKANKPWLAETTANAVFTSLDMNSTVGCTCQEVGTPLLYGRYPYKNPGRTILGAAIEFTVIS